MTLPVDHPLAGPATPPTCAAALAEIRTAAYDIPNIIGGREVPTGRTMPIVTPHAHSVQLGQVHCASPEYVGEAIKSATDTARWWGRLDWEERSAPRHWPERVPKTWSSSAAIPTTPPAGSLTRRFSR